MYYPNDDFPTYTQTNPLIYLSSNKTKHISVKEVCQFYPLYRNRLHIWNEIYLRDLIYQPIVISSLKNWPKLLQKHTKKYLI
jgi:hypothetical protein